MPITPLEIQQLYLMQNHIGHMEHAKKAVRKIATKSQDRDIHLDSFMKDSTVVKTESTGDDNKIKEKPNQDKQSSQKQSYMSYRKRKIINAIDDKTTEEIEIVEEIKSQESIKGAKIDILG